MKYLCPLMIFLTATGAYGQDLTWQRDGKTLGQFVVTTDETTPVERGELMRSALDAIKPAILKTDTLIVRGTSDFGGLYAIYLPSCNYLGDGGKFLTHCKIDPTNDASGKPTKPGSTPGIVFGAYQRFEKMEFGGECFNKGEDGGLLGWSVEGDGEVEFEDCIIDASQGMDWCIYTWHPQSKRKITIRNSTVRYCRLGIACASSGHPWQEVLAEKNCKFLGDANGSTSFGWTSKPDPVTGGVLSAVLNRSGKTVLRDSHFVATGLTKEYLTPPKFTVPRIASICTNQYSANSGPTEFIIERCQSSIMPGVESVRNDIDIRGVGKLTLTLDDAKIKAAEEAGAKLVAAAKGGSGAGGEVTVWKPTE